MRKLCVKADIYKTSRMVTLGHQANLRAEAASSPQGAPEDLTITCERIFPYRY